MDEATLARKRAELDAIMKEIEAERSQRVLRDPRIRQARTDRRLLLERELAAAAGDEYAEHIKLDIVIGDEWHIMSNFGRETAVFCGDVGADSCALIVFDHTEEFRVSGLSDDVDAHPMNGRGLGPYGMFIVRNSTWKRDMLTATSLAGPGHESWLSSFDHFILRSKGGELECLARGYEYRVVSEGIEAIRERSRFWKKFME